MDTYELKQVSDDGSGYVVFLWVDGTSTGQQFHGLPVDDKALFDAALCDLMQETHQRVNPQAAKQVSVDVKADLGKSKPLDDLRNAAVAMQVNAAPIALK